MIRKAKSSYKQEKSQFEPWICPYCGRQIHNGKYGPYCEGKDFYTFGAILSNQQLTNFLKNKESDIITIVNRDGSQMQGKLYIGFSENTFLKE